MGTSSCRSTLTKEFRCLPESLHAADRFSGKVVGPDEERIIMQRLRTRRLVVGIVQANQGISQKRCQLTTRLADLRGRSGRRRKDFCYVALHLHVGVMIVVDSRSPLGSFAAGEDGPRHLKFSSLGSQVDQPLCRLLPVRLFGQGIPERQKCVERDQPLVVEYGAEPGGQLPMYLLPLWSTLPGPGQQVDDFILRSFGLASREPEQFSQRSSPCVIQLRGRSNRGIRPDHLLPRIVQLRLRVRNLSLPRQNLPDSDTCLKGAESVSANSHGHSVEPLSYVQKQCDGLVA